VNRTYKLHIPRNYKLNNTIPIPLLVSFHGWSGNAIENEQDAEFISKLTLVNHVNIFKRFNKNYVLVNFK
jgi:hypothetical protein